MKNMSITNKMIIASVTTFFLVIASTFMILNSVIFHYIDQMEASKVEDKFNSIELLLKREKENLQRTSLDWAKWDETYQYMNGLGKEEYEKNNVQESALEELNLNFMFFINDQGNMVNTVTRSLNNDNRDLLANKFIIKPNSLLKIADNDFIASGIIDIEGKLFFLVASPITTTDGQSPSNGVLVIGREIDESLIQYINAVTLSEVHLTGALDSIIKTGNAINRTEDMITASQTIKDINGDHRLLLTMSMERAHYNMGKYYIKVFAGIFFIMLSIILLISVFAFHRIILKRLLAIHEFIKIITKTKDTQTKLYISGDDEITDIAHSMNEMLTELVSANKSSKEISKKMQAILEATNDGYLEYNLQTKEYYISPKWSQFSEEDKTKDGFDPFNEYFKRIHPDSLTLTKMKFNQLIYSNHEYEEVEYKLIGVNGKIKWVLHKGKVMERDSSGKAIWVVNILLDITERKEYEERILKLNYDDKITGLRNRIYMEEKFSEVNRWEEGEYSIIMGDVNGLKLINDTFGHKEGDRLICKIGQILKNTCTADDIVARWGGDEFIILSLNKSEEFLVKLMQSISDKCGKVTDFGFKVNIALGSASKNEKSDAESVMNLAEERMYRSKLTAAQSARNATIVSLEHTLYEKNHETEEHTQRIKKLAFQLGKKLNLSQDELYELELLSLLHDIGKIGIPDQILIKPGKLTEEEWKIIQKHTEIGYRIAKATPGLEHVSEKILSHHENYNGKGYPQGLKGEEIPLLSRIIAIVDSFDVMTHKRSYKEAASMDYAIGELKRCSGTQFDPVIIAQFLELLDTIPQEELGL